MLKLLQSRYFCTLINLLLCNKRYHVSFQCKLLLFALWKKITYWKVKLSVPVIFLPAILSKFISDITYLKTVLPEYVEEEFFTYLRNLTANDVTMYAIEEGTVVFPKEPLIVIEGPLPIVQLMETPLLNLVNYAR